MSRLGPHKVNTIVVGDCKKVMRQMPDGCCNLIFADPPFNAGKDYGGGFNDNKELSKYYGWLLPRLEEMERILAIGGTLWLMNDTRHIGFCQTCLNSLGMTFCNMVVWAYSNPTPAQKRLPKTWRPILFYSKGKPSSFHPERIRLGKATLYHNPNRAKTHPVHDLWPDIPKLVGGFLAPPELLTTLEGRFAHLAQMPERIAERICLLASDEGQVVFDPFVGSGTTTVVADRLHRNFFGCDTNAYYVEMALKRIVEDRKKQAQLELF